MTTETILFDCECNELLDKVTKMHCIAAHVLETGENIVSHTKEGMAIIVDRLEKADRTVAHNSIFFDIPLLKMFYPEFKPQGDIFDTLVIARAIWPDVKTRDYIKNKAGIFPGKLIGSHSLEAWGYRLKIKKGEYGKQENAWDKWTPEMEEYCVQDVAVLTTLYNRILKTETPEACFKLENQFASVIQTQIERGVCFDEKEAVKLLITLQNKQNEINEELQKLFTPQYISPDLGQSRIARGKSKFMPGLEKGNKFCKIKLQEFNPNSRQQIAERFITKYGWTPTETTEKGATKLSESILNDLDYPEAKLLSEYLMITKRLGMLSDGNNAWLKLVKKGRIHGRVNTGGAVSGRCTHSSPNLAQVPAVYSPYGKECRSLFKATKGMVLVGCDASGLELRCLAHYLANYDKGEYAEIILEGDIHTANQKAAGLPTRNMGKSFIYSWLYGAGAEKIGQIIEGGKKEGEKLKNKFFKAYPQIKLLMDDVQKTTKERGYLKGLDGRRMKTRSQHSALNLLLQGAGALIMKRFAIELYKTTTHLNRYFVLNCHDEIQAEVATEHVKEYSEACLKAFNKAGEFFNFRIPIEGEVKTGETWRNTH